MLKRRKQRKLTFHLTSLVGIFYIVRNNIHSVLMESKNILLLGGSGFIGSNLAKLALGNNFLTIVDLEKPRHNFFDTFKKGDITHQKIFEDLNGKFDVVFDFASPSSMRLYEKSPVDLPSHTIKGFLNVLEYCKNYGVSNLIFPSSCTVYGNSTGLKPKKIEPLNVYASLKYFYEQMAKVYSRFFQVAALRIFMGYGPGEEFKENIASPIFLFLNDAIKKRKPKIWGDGSQSRDAVYVDDIVEGAYKSIFLNEQFTTFDVGVGESTPFNKILEVISDILGIEVEADYTISDTIGYQSVTKADPSVFIDLLGHEPFKINVGIRKFNDYLRSKNELEIK